MSAVARDAVFISYSHRDKRWLERLHVFLKPQIRPDNIQVWDDRRVKPGDLWFEEIKSALNRACVAVLLVSPDFLASDFIIQRELPLILDAAKRGEMRVFCVSVSASPDEGLPLDAFEWAVKKTPLDKLSRPKRHEALVEISYAVRDAMKMTGASATESWSGSVRRLAEQPQASIGLPEAGRLGDMHEVPPLPVPHITRAEFTGVRDEILRAPGPRAPRTLGLYGSGGAGKSVLASALARDMAIRRAFPDGVYWLHLGETPDITRLQSELLARLEGTEETFQSPETGRERLAGALQSRRSFVVLDDVWDVAHAEAFNVLGPDSQLLVTTRDAAVITVLRGVEERLGELTVGQALQLLAAWADVDPGTLPSEARQLAVACGGLPLALAVVGAQIRAGESWSDLLSSIQLGVGVYHEHPYASAFASLERSVAALPREQAERYVELAVFPAAEAVPESVVLSMWASDLDATRGRKLLATFAQKSLIHLTDADGRRSIRLHDLQREFLRLISPDLTALHAKLLARYEEVCPSGWHQGPADGYFFEHLTYHLAEAGRHDEVERLLTDLRYLTAKLRNGGINLLLEDFQFAWSPSVAPVHDFLRLSAHVLGRDDRQLPAQILGRLRDLPDPALHSLVAQASDSRDESWLRPLSASLTVPGGALLRTLTGHRAAVLCTAITPDGRRAVSGALDGTLRVWDLERGLESQARAEPSGGIKSLVLFPDGRCAASAARDGGVTIWDLDHVIAPQPRIDRGIKVTAIALIPPQREVVLGRADGRIDVWSIDHRHITGQVEADAEVAVLAVAPEVRRVIAGGADGSLKICDLATRTSQLLDAALEDPITAVAITPDGRRAVSASLRGPLKVWDVPDGSLVNVLAGHDDWVNALAITGDGRSVISVSEDRTLKVWDVSRGVALQTLTGHDRAITGVAATADGKIAVTSSSDQTLKVWNLERPRVTSRTSGHSERVTALAVPRVGNRSYSVSASLDGTVIAWDVPHGCAPLMVQTHEAGVTAVAVDDTASMAVSASGRIIVLWDLQSGNALHTLDAHTDAVTALAMTGDGNHILSASKDGTLRLWDRLAGTLLRTMTCTGPVLTVAPAADGRHAVSASIDQTLLVWDLVEGVEFRRLVGHERITPAVALMPDSRAVISASWDSTLKVWDIGSGTALHTLVGHSQPVIALAVAPQGGHIISASWDRTLRVWDVRRGITVRTLVGHEDIVTSVAVMDDDHLVSGSADQSVILWSISRAAIVARFIADASISSCAVLPDRTVVAGDVLGRVHHLRVYPESPRRPNAAKPLSWLGTWLRRQGLWMRMRAYRPNA